MTWHFYGKTVVPSQIMQPSRTILPQLLTFAVASISLSSGTTVYLSQTGAGPFSPPNAEAWGGANRSNFSFAFETFIDYTPTIAGENNPIMLWETGGSGVGSALILDGVNLHYFAGNTNDDVLTRPHGMTVPLDDVQIVASVEMGAAGGGDEVLSLHVNGNLLGSITVNSGNDWTGGENGSALGQVSGTQRYTGTSLFTPGNVVNYPETDISFNAYWLNSGGGPADNTIENIVIPEPSSLFLCGIGSLAFLRRRR
ncbi:MAG: PEP-CTERM sorting domain-containing protein [Akkermansiaceae bacterium]|jgi:hypothetical protein